MPRFARWYRGWSMVVLGAVMVMLTVGSVTHGDGAMALVAVGQTASSVFMAPLVARLIEAKGWRDAILIQGIAVAAFGAASLGTTEGLVSPMIAISAAVAVWGAGASFDTTGDYRRIFLVFSTVLGLALLFALIVRFGTRAQARSAPAGAAVRHV